MSDSEPSLMRVCECISRILSHASRLKCDDVNLKGLLASHRVCSACDLYALENIHHIVMQCPAFYDTRSQMYDDTIALEGEIPGRFREEPSMVFGWLMGGCIEGVDTSNLRSL